MDRLEREALKGVWNSYPPGGRKGADRRQVLAGAGAALSASAGAASAKPAGPSAGGPITIAAQGSYAAGGKVITSPGSLDLKSFFAGTGDTAHVDHAYVRWQRPLQPRALPLVFWHGGGQFMRTWETTPDGREGFDTLMLRRGWEVHLVDQPRRGGASYAGSREPMPPAPTLDRALWQIFRLGVYPDHFPNSQFPKGPEALDQYWRQRVQDAGPEEQEIVVPAVSAVFDRLGRGVLVTHSNSGKWGFITAARNPRVKAIVSYEPGAFVVPDDYTPRPLEAADPYVRRLATPLVIPAAQFAQLTRIPIQIVIGDNVPTEPSPYPGLDLWRAEMIRAREFCELVNARGGRASLLHLPDAGVRGNTHFPFSDLNNIQIADLFSDYLHQARLDGRA